MMIMGFYEGTSSASKEKKCSSRSESSLGLSCYEADIYPITPYLHGQSSLDFEPNFSRVKWERASRFIYAATSGAARIFVLGKENLSFYANERVYRSWACEQFQKMKFFQPCLFPSTSLCRWVEPSSFIFSCRCPFSLTSPSPFLSCPPMS